METADTTMGRERNGPMITVEEVSKAFSTKAGPLEVLSKVALKVYPGDFSVLVGPSGCGKSTLLRIISGLLPPSSGKVFFRGKEVTEPPNGLGMIFQTPVLVAWRTVIDNVLFSAELTKIDPVEAKKRAGELLSFVGLKGFEQYYPYQLSGGMQQRVALCRALVTEPDLLLMDEPFAALDAITREKLDMELSRIQQVTHKTIIYVTHNIAEAVFLSDKIVVMSARPGRIAFMKNNSIQKPRTLSTYTDPVFTSMSGEIRQKVEHQH